MLYRLLLVCSLTAIVPWCAAENSSSVSIRHIHHDVELAAENYYIKSTFQFAKSDLSKEQKLPLVTSRVFDDIKSLAVYYNGKKIRVDKPMRIESFVLPLLDESFTLFWLNIDGGVEENAQLTIRYQLKRTRSDMELLGHRDFLMVGKLLPAINPVQDVRYEVKQRAFVDYSNPVIHSATLRHAPDLGVVASARPSAIDGGHKVQGILVAQFLIGFYRKAAWDSQEVLVAGTPFTIMARKQGSYISLDALTKAVKLIWPQYVERFYGISRHIFFLGLDGPLGGASVGNNVLAVYDSNEVSDELQSYLHDNSGFKNKKENTMGYMEEVYPESTQPVWNYTLDMVAHELGHLYFGFGETYENARARHDLWLSLGLGLIYDREFYRNIVGDQPQLVDFSTRRWREHFSKIKDLDQRLINPDTSTDAKYNLDRLQSFSHGKSAFVLRALRKKVGEREFDQVVLKYLKGNLGGFGYPSFRSGIKHIYPDIASFEVERGIR